MSAPPRARLAEPLLQLPFAIAAVALLQAHFSAGLAALAVLAAVWPPAVPWRPLAVCCVLLRYLPFAAAWLAFVIAYLRLAHALGHPVAPQEMLRSLAEQGTALPGFWLRVTSIVVVAPFCEELLFRGYLFTALATLLPIWATQLVTAAAFGLVHGLDYALPIGVLALLFGWLRQRYGALLPSMFAHAVHNGITVVVTLSWPGHLDLLYPR